MSLKKPWRFEDWTIYPSYIVLPEEKQSYWCDKDNGAFRNLKPAKNAKTRSEVEQLLK
jgi:hypothetical protein